LTNTPKNLFREMIFYNDQQRNVRGSSGIHTLPMRWFPHTPDAALPLVQLWPLAISILVGVSQTPAGSAIVGSAIRCASHVKVILYVTFKGQ
jgi:hypothetical protein